MAKRIVGGCNDGASTLIVSRKSRAIVSASGAIASSVPNGVIAPLPPRVLGAQAHKPCCDDCAKPGAVPCGSSTPNPYATARYAEGDFAPFYPGRNDGRGIPGIPGLGNVKILPRTSGGRRAHPSPTCPENFSLRVDRFCDYCESADMQCWEVDVGLDGGGAMQHALTCVPDDWAAEGGYNFAKRIWAAAVCKLASLTLAGTPITDRPALWAVCQLRGALYQARALHVPVDPTPFALAIARPAGARTCRKNGVFQPGFGATQWTTCSAYSSSVPGDRFDPSAIFGGDGSACTPP